MRAMNHAYLLATCFDILCDAARQQAILKGKASMFAIFDDKLDTVSHAIRGVFADLHGKDVLRYLAKALPLALFLTLAGACATSLPWFAFPPILLIYALVATMGALYYVMIRRVHKQDMFSEGGELSKYNRKWLIWFIALFVFSLFSAFFFVLGAPRWDGLIWILIWAAVPLYYLAFHVADRIAKKEFRSQYRKAKAMKWSSGLVLFALCLVYAVLSVQSSVDAQFDALDVLRHPYMPFADAPSVFLSEVDKLSALMNNLTNYGLVQIAKTSFFAAFAVKFALALSVFLGVVSQFAFCLLSWQEMKGEFRLLPVREDVDVFADGKTRLRTEERQGERPYLLRYFVAIGLLSVASFFAFWLLEDTTSKARETEEYTAADVFVKESTDNIVAVLEGAIEEHKEERDINERYRQKFSELIENRKQTLDPLINEYYDQCLLHVDSYLGWSEGIFGGVAGYLGGFGEGRAVENFKAKVVDPVDKSELERAYEDYVDTMIQTMSEYWIEINDGGSDSPMGVSSAGEYMKELAREKGRPDFWRPLDKSPMDESTRKALLGAGGDTNEETRKDEVSALIERARSDTFASLEEFESICSDDMSGQIAGLSDNVASK